MDTDQAEEHEEEGGESNHFVVQQLVGSEEDINMAGKVGGKGQGFGKATQVEKDQEERTTSCLHLPVRSDQ